MKYMSPEMQALCHEIVAACQETGQRIDACIACGVDVAEEQQANSEQLKVARSLIDHFTPPIQQPILTGR